MSAELFGLAVILALWVVLRIMESRTRERRDQELDDLARLNDAIPYIDLKRLAPTDRYREEERHQKDQFRAGAVFDLGCFSETDYPRVAMRYTVKHDMAIAPRSTARASSPDKLTRGDILATIKRLDGPVGDRIRDEAGIRG